MPSRLIGRELKALVYPGDGPRVSRRNPCAGDAAAIAWISQNKLSPCWPHLAQKARRFCHYQYREELFPSLTFRRAYDALKEGRPERADKEYLSILHLAAVISEQDVEAALAALLEDKQLPLSTTLRDLVQAIPSEMPPVSIPAPDLCSYDLLLSYLSRAPKEAH